MANRIKQTLISGLAALTLGAMAPVAKAQDTYFVPTNGTITDLAHSASHGDTIKVAPGHYIDHPAHVHKTVHIRALNPADPPRFSYTSMPALGAGWVFDKTVEGDNFSTIDDILVNMNNQVDAAAFAVMQNTDIHFLPGVEAYNVGTAGPSLVGGTGIFVTTTGGVTLDGFVTMGVQDGGGSAIEIFSQVPSAINDAYVSFPQFDADSLFSSPRAYSLSQESKEVPLVVRMRQQERSGFEHLFSQPMGEIPSRALTIRTDNNVIVNGFVVDTGDTTTTASPGLRGTAAEYPKYIVGIQEPLQPGATGISRIELRGVSDPYCPGLYIDDPDGIITVNSHVVNGQEYFGECSSTTGVPNQSNEGGLELAVQNLSGRMRFSIANQSEMPQPAELSVFDIAGRPRYHGQPIMVAPGQSASWTVNSRELGARGIYLGQARMGNEKTSAKFSYLN